MSEFKKRLYLYTFTVGPLGFIITFLSFLGVINFTFCGFALDSNDLLYIGKSNKIDVYDNGKYVNTVFEYDGGYFFTIQDEKLYIAASRDVIAVRDLTGKLIEIIDDSAHIEAKRLEKQKNVFLKDDAEYRATNTMGYYKITKLSNGESEVIFRKPLIDYICGVILLLSALSVPVFLITTCTIEYREGLQKEDANPKKPPLKSKDQRSI